MRRHCFLLACLAAAGGTPIAAQHYAESSGWHFRNFKDPVYSWDIYRDTFIGIPPTEDPWSSAFDVLFYNQLYKDKLSSNGNCYGISLQSLMMLKKGGHFGYCVPIPQYSGDAFGAGPGGDGLGPTDPMLRRAINVMHGHQVNLPTLQWILDLISQDKNRNAAYACTAFQDARLRSDPTLVSITKTLNPDDGGHTMVAYDSQDFGGGNKRLYVYDPNRTWGNPDAANRGWYTGNQNFIQISGNSWSFTMAGTLGTWSGNPGSGGNIMIIPISVTGPHARSPASLGDQIIGQILTSLLITGASAEVEQVVDATGKRLFRPGTREIDTDLSTGMMTMLPWYPSDQGSRNAPKGTALFHLGRSAGTLHVTVRAGDPGYALTVGGARNHVIVKGAGGSGSDVISFHEVGSDLQRLELQNLRGTSVYDIQLVHADPANQRVQILRSYGLQLPEGAVLKLAAEDQHRALTLATTAPLRYDLELQAITPRGVDVVARKSVVHEEAVERSVRPRDWQNLRGTEILERTTLTLRPGRPTSATSGR